MAVGPCVAVAPGDRRQPARLALVAVCAALAIAAAVDVRLAVDARRELAAAAVAAEPGAATLHLGRAIRANPWPLPLARTASDLLAAHAEQLEPDRPALAIEAWRELRSARFAIRQARSDRDPWVRRSEARLAALGRVTEAEADPAPLPSATASLMVAGSFAAFGGAVLGLLCFGLDEEARMRRSARAWLVAAIFGLAAWMASLLLA